MNTLKVRNLLSILVTALLLMPCLAMGQTTYRKYFQSNGNQPAGPRIQFAADPSGGLAFTHPGSGQGNAGISRIDIFGDPIWTRFYEGGSNFNSYEAIATGPDGSIVFGGNLSFSPNGEAYLAKTDSSGNLQWTTSRDFSSGTTAEFTSRIEVASDGNIIWIARVAAEDYVTAIAPGGTFLWQQKIPVGWSIADADISDGAQFLALGGYSGGTFPAGFYAKLDMATGNVLWSRSIPLTANPNYSTQVYAVDFAANGDLIGLRRHDAGSPALGLPTVVERLGANGQPIWQRTYYSDDFVLDPEHMVESLQGDIFVHFQFRFNFGSDFRAVILELDSAGNQVDNGMIGRPDIASGFPLRMDKTVDGDFLLGGRHSASNYAFELYKQGVDPLCYDSTVTIMDSLSSRSFVAGPVFSTSNLQPSPFPLSSSIGVLVDSTACFSPGCLVAPSIGAASAQVCLGDTIFLSHTGIGGSAFTWKINGIPSSNSPNYDFVPAAAGAYSVTLVVSEGVCVDSAFANFVVYPLPEALPFAWTSNLLSVDFQNQQLFSDLQWDFGDGDSSTLADPTHVYAADGSYLVCLTVTDANNCSDSICQTVTVSTVGKTAALLQDAFLYPNPSSGATKLQWQGAPMEGWWLEVLDMMGRICLERKRGSDREMAIDLSAFPAGSYLVRIGNARTGEMGMLVFRKE